MFNGKKPQFPQSTPTLVGWLIMFTGIYINKSSFISNKLFQFMEALWLTVKHFKLYSSAAQAKREENITATKLFLLACVILDCFKGVPPSPISLNSLCWIKCNASPPKLSAFVKWLFSYQILSIKWTIVLLRGTQYQIFV